MLHTEFRENRLLRRSVLKVFSIYGRGGHLGHVTRTIYINIRSLFPKRLHIKFGFDWPAVSEEKIFENGGQRTDGGRTDAGSMGIL